MSPLATGHFTVQRQPLAFEGQAAGTPLGRLSIAKSITGDLVASTQGQMLSAMGTVAGSAGYVAIERVDGTLRGKAGSAVLQHSGSMDRGAPSLRVSVVPDSGTAELTGLQGEFKIVQADGQHLYEFSHILP